MLTNRRIHLSSKDGDGGNPTNMADVSFDLTKARIKVETPLNLNLGLIKSMISSDISLMGTSETNPVFSLIIEQPPTAPLTSNPYYFYFTETKYEFPYGVGNPDSVYIPISHIDTVETFIGIINETINTVTGGSPTTLFAIDNSNNTLIATNNINNLSIPMSLYNPKIPSADSRSSYRPQNETIMRMLGININIQLPETSTQLGKDIVNRDILYPVGIYMPPILVKTDLSLNSVSSNSKLNGKILASINCEFALSSESYDFNFS